MSIDRGVDPENVVHIHNGIFTQPSKIPAFFATWMDLETIMLSEVSQIGSHQHHMLSPTYGI